ncbi:recombinase family protein [Neorhizobium sp. AL 9.2.2]|uniref:recombinase family protein n=1 Tax=Neorhizobium sp. AL 9.2.2 TaxID=2712894 RepID=UPI00157183FB|nr:recombinase family protein [Neorhizobium sp. AL 9.2.2]NSY20213.1 recombinase family protein [Neorhizobium sp. AL 9.2.2]
MFLQALRTFSRQNQDIRDIRGQSLASEVVTTSDFTDVVLAILGVAAKLERRRILDRTARGHEAAKARGVKNSVSQSLPTISAKKQRHVANWDW